MGEPLLLTAYSWCFSKSFYIEALVYVDAIYEVVVAGQLWGSRFFALIYPRCKEFLWVNVSISFKDLSNIGVLLLSDLAPFYSEGSSNSSMMKHCELAEVIFSKIPRLTLSGRYRSIW